MMTTIKIITAAICVLFADLHEASAQIKVGDQPTVFNKAVAIDAQGSNGLQGLWLPRVSDTSVAGIRSLNPPDGLIIYHPPSGKLFLRSNSTWVSYNTSAITTLISSGVSVAGPAVTLQTGTNAGVGNDFNIVTNTAANTVTYNIPDASAAIRGVVTTGTQTLGGAKTLANGVTVNNGSTLNGGTTANSGLTVSGATASTSNLTLGITATTATSGVTTTLLSVDSTGKVYLTTTNVQANKPSRILNYTLTITGVVVAANSTYNITTPLPAAAGVSFPATVFLSPSTALSNGTTVDWATILSNNLVTNISTRSNTQDFTSYVFYVTIVDF